MGYVTFEVDPARSIHCECVLVMGPVSHPSVHGAGCLFRHRQEWPIETHDVQATQALPVQTTQTHSVQSTSIQANTTRQQRQAPEVRYETALSSWALVATRTEGQ